MNATRAVAHIDTSDEFWRPILGGDMNNCPTNRSLPTSFLQNLTHTTTARYGLNWSAQYTLFI
jgi:hypothetical protein